LTGDGGAIGVFDSGVGGLTVLRALRSVLPRERFVYLGDTARLPYGTKSAATVVRYSLQCADALVARGIRCLVVACNTASASALDALRLRYPGIPVIGVIEPGAAAAVAASRTRHIAVIGTEGTIGGGAYQAAIQRLDARVRVTAQACSLFVAVAEEKSITVAATRRLRTAQPSLSRQLRELETEGLVERLVDPGPPVRVSYRLTSRGRALEPVLAAVANWADSWLTTVEAAVG